MPAARSTRRSPAATSASTTRARPGAIDPTPTVGMVGLLDRVADRVPSHFAHPGDEILILGATRGELGGSAYWAEVFDFIGGPPRAWWISTPSGGSSGCWWPRPVSGCSARRTTAADGGLAGGAWPRPRWAGPTPRPDSAPPWTSTAYAPGVAAEVSSTARTAPARWSPRHRPMPGALRGAGRASTACRRIGPAGSASRTATLELRVGGGLFTWSIGALRQTYFTAIPRRMRHPDVDRSAGE